eukprot:gene15278-17080_t
MSRLNNIIKFVLLNMNILMCFIGSFFVGLAFYLWFADFGSLSKSFFIGVGFISALFGLVLGLLSCIGCQGINNQTRKFGEFSHSLLRMLGDHYYARVLLDWAQNNCSALRLSDSRSHRRSIRAENSARRHRE